LTGNPLRKQPVSSYNPSKDNWRNIVYSGKINIGSSCTPGAKMAEQVLLQIKNLTKSYGDIRAVRDLSLDIFSGEVFGLLGPNGAGKTTIIKLMSGLLKPDSGEVILRGKPLAAGDVKTRGRIGICPQENVLWTKLTPVEQLIFLGNMYGMNQSLIRQYIRTDYDHHDHDARS